MANSFTRFVFFAILFAAFSTRTIAQGLPHPDHIVILIEENKPYDQDFLQNLVFGNPAAPYVSAMLTDSNSAVFSNFSAYSHPSEPNYLYMFSGSNQGVTDDGVPASFFTTPNLAYDLKHKGLTFVTYSQDLPSVGFDGASSGSYVRKHNPVTNWVGTGQNQVPGTMNQPYTAFPTDFTQLPTVSYVVPNEDSDMHNGNGAAAIAAGDYWMKEHLDSFIRWARTHNTLFIYTFDEDDGFDNNLVPTLFFGSMVKGGHYHNAENFATLLRTIEDIYGLAHDGDAGTSVPILYCWRAVSGINDLKAPVDLKVYPNPAHNLITFDAGEWSEKNTEISIYDVSGRSIAHYTMPASKPLEVNTTGYEAGLYFYRFTQDNANLQTGKFVLAH